MTKRTMMAGSALLLFAAPELVAQRDRPAAFSSRPEARTATPTKSIAAALDRRHRKTFILTGAAAGALTGVLALRNEHLGESHTSPEVAYAVTIALGAAVGAAIGWLVYRLAA